MQYLIDILFYFIVIINMIQLIRAGCVCYQIMIRTCVYVEKRIKMLYNMLICFSLYKWVCKQAEIAGINWLSDWFVDCFNVKR